MAIAPVILLAGNVAYLWSASSADGRLVALIGCVLAAGLWLGSAASPLTRSWLEHHVRLRLSRTRTVQVAATFGGSLVVLLAAHVSDSTAIQDRTCILLSWLLAIWLMRTEPAAPIDQAGRGACRLATTTYAFILVASLFWLGLVWDLGANRAVLANPRPDRLTQNFELWESAPAREHLFLGWLSVDDFRNRRAYTNHLQPYLLTVYGFAKLAQKVVDVPLQTAVRFTPFLIALIGALAFACVLPFTGEMPPRETLGFHIAVFLAVGFLLTESHYWQYSYEYNLDTIFPLIVFLSAVVWAGAQHFLQTGRTRPLIIACGIFGMFGWMYWPLLIVAIWCYYGAVARTRNENTRVLAIASVACALAGTAVYLLPRALASMSGYTSVASPFAFRSGLDGDTRYFQNVVQAVFRPPCCGPRHLWDLLFPAFVPLLAYIIWTLRTSARRPRLLEQYFFLAAPYLFSLGLVPQSVSVHPYLYDQLLFLPAAFVSAQVVLLPEFREWLNGPRALTAGLVTLLLLMANLIRIAQAMRHLLGS